jgi:hypothetical protein
MTDLLDLAVRVEGAEGPDRELDVAIVYALHPDIGHYEGQCIGDDPIFWHEPYRKQPCPEFTASLDAAMGLVPEGWQTESLSWWAGEGAHCRLLGSVLRDGRWTRFGREGRAEGAGATPALALCAAALRARASKDVSQ